jgi:hypothetical protein
MATRLYISIFIDIIIPILSCGDSKREMSGYEDY